MQALCECNTRRNKEISSATVGPQQANVAIEVIGTDRPGLFSEISEVLMSFGFNITSATAWTHNCKVACIIDVEDASKPGPINDKKRLAHVEDQLRDMIEAGEREERIERGVRTKPTMRNASLFSKKMAKNTLKFSAC